MSQPEVADSQNRPRWSTAEEELRALVEPDPAQADRLARRVLAEPAVPSSHGGAGLWKWAAGTAAAFLVAFLGVSMFHRIPSPEAPAHQAPTQRALSYQIVNTGGVVAVTTGSGQIQAIVAGGES